MCAALLIQHTKRMCRVVLSSMTCLALPYFFTSSHERHDFRNKVFEYKMRVSIFCTTFFQNISHSLNSAIYYYKCKQVFM